MKSVSKIELEIDLVKERNTVHKEQLPEELQELIAKYEEMEFGRLEVEDTNTSKSLYKPL